MEKEIRKSILKLDKWIEKNGWAGYDPYDIRGAVFFLNKKSDNFFKEILRKSALSLELISPLFIRRILGARKQINAKAMGLFAEGYLNLFRATGEDKYLDRSKECLTWLESNYSKGYSGYCWGYPFDWQSKIFIPKDIPSAVVSSICGQAFWEYYQITKEKKYLNICQSICKFFLKDLNIDNIASDKMCFSYTPLDNFRVHNANLFAAEFLIRIGKEVKNQNYIDQGLRAVNYTLSEQNKDGSICYWGKGQEKKCRIDHYHSGFEIRSLYSIWKLTGNERIYEALKRYYQFYLNNLFENKTIPKITPKNIYPINIHACAEAILCNSLLQNDFPKAREYLENSTKWIIKNMQTSQGWFIYRIENLIGIKWKVKIPYIRWSQAWMLSALSNFIRINFYE